MRKFLLGFFSLVALVSCTPNEKEFEIYGHRGWRGHYPENSIQGFVAAAKAGVTHFEMDVVISGDGLVVVSHEPWLSSKICSDPNRNPIYESTEQAYNIFQMRYSEVARAECGLIAHADFPDQKKISAKKPLLSAVLDTLEKIRPSSVEYFYAIEIKSTPQGDNRFHPVPQIFADNVLGVVKLNRVEDRVYIQSFDNRVLIYIHEYFPEIPLILLVDENESVDEKWVDLAFTPEIIAPHYSIVSKEMVKDIHDAGARIIPWTVNDIHDAQRLRELGVDGLITDYPNQHLLPQSSD